MGARDREGDYTIKDEKRPTESSILNDSQYGK